MLVKVFTDIGRSRPVIMNAKVIKPNSDNFIIQYLSPTSERYHGKTLYRYEDTTYEIDSSSITEILDDDADDDMIGFTAVSNGFIKYECIDGEYMPSESELSDSGSEISFVNSDDEEADEEADDDYYAECSGDD
jgi:hypothetical protein